MVRFLIILFVTFAAMELFSYLVHRFVYHGWAWFIHKSHHAPRQGAFEWNDIFPVLFASLTAILMMYALADPLGLDLLAIALGTTAYGAVYFFVHDLYIHRRVRNLRLSIPFLRKIKQAHALHHRHGGEPYGLLLFADPRKAAAESVDEDETA